MRPGKRRALPDAEEVRLLDLVELANAHVRAKVEHPFRVIQQQFWLSEDQTPWYGQELLQSECACGADKSVIGSSSTLARG